MDDPKDVLPMLDYLERVKNYELALIDGTQQRPASKPLPADPSPMDVYLHSMEQQLGNEPRILYENSQRRKRRRADFFPDYIRLVK